MAQTNEQIINKLFSDLREMCMDLAYPLQYSKTLKSSSRRYIAKLHFSVRTWDHSRMTGITLSLEDTKHNKIVEIQYDYEKGKFDGQGTSPRKEFMHKTLKDIVLVHQLTA